MGLDEWLSRGDLDELIREIDRRCDARDWSGVSEVARRSRVAIERGHQLWPAASYAEYRIALDAPAPMAASVVTEGSGWMAPGPLSEVVAQNHGFDELRDELEPGPLAAVVAGERVVRGEDVGDHDVAGELPGSLVDWEPHYRLATYSPDGVSLDEVPAVEPSGMTELDPAARDQARRPEEAAEGEAALRGAVAHWASMSDGTVRTVGVEGAHAEALAALGPSPVLWRDSTLQEVGGLLAWAAADGAALGRRRGAAAGRSELWWCLANLCGLEEEWPCDPGEEAASLRFGLWLPVAPVRGWSCRFTVEDPLDGLAWAVDAHEQPAKDL